MKVTGTRPYTRKNKITYIHHPYIHTEPVPHIPPGVCRVEWVRCKKCFRCLCFIYLSLYKGCKKCCTVPMFYLPVTVDNVCVCVCVCTSHLPLKTKACPLHKATTPFLPLIVYSAGEEGPAEGGRASIAVLSVSAAVRQWTCCLLTQS